jgi:hypothetical protein
MTDRVLRLGEINDIRVRAFNLVEMVDLVGTFNLGS